MTAWYLCKLKKFPVGYTCLSERCDWMEWRDEYRIKCVVQAAEAVSLMMRLTR
jgi:hypothetical protein